MLLIKLTLFDINIFIIQVGVVYLAQTTYKLKSLILHWLKHARRI